MAGVLQHLRSSTLNKRPNPASMVDGQIAINYASGSPGMFFKDSNGSLVKVGPVHVGATAPNVSPASGGTAGNSLGEQWLDTSGGTYVFKIWDGAAWRSEAGEFVNSTGDTMTGSLTMGPSADLIFEGSVDDGFETTLTVVNPTADRTITFPNVTGTVVTTGDSETVTSTMIRNDTIVNADINSSAAIAGTKISPDFGSQNVTTTGTSTAASFIPTSSTVPTNGVYLPAANSVALSTNGTGRLFVDSSGNVTLGEKTSTVFTALRSTSPATFQIRHGSGSDTSLLFTSNDSAANNSLQLQAWNGSSYNAIDITGSFCSVSTAGSERLRITSAGLVGVGTSSPGYKLDVNGEVAFSPNTAGKNTFYFTTNASNDASLFLKSDTTNKVNIQANGTSYFNGGNVGIGTSAPVQKLDVADGDFVLRKTTGGDTSGVTSQVLRIGTQSGDLACFYAISAGGGGPSGRGGALYIQTKANNGAPTDRLVITEAGLVGIGTTSPGARLHVAGSTVLGDDGTNGRFSVETNTSRIALLASTTGFGAYEDLEVYAAATIFHRANLGEAARIDSSGRLLVGTSSARSNFFNANISAGIQLEGLGDTNRLLSVVSNTNDAFSEPNLILGKTRGTALGSNTVVQSNDPLGSVCFQGADGSEFVEAASIKAFVDGTPGANDMPGRLVFSVTADGASSPTEALRITSSQDLMLSQSGSGFFVGTTTDGAYRIGRSSYAVSTGTLYIGNAAIQVSSDVRLKDNIEDTSLDALEVISNIKVKDFTWNDPSDTSYNNRNARGKWTGLIAQELVDVLPFVVNAPRKEDGSIDHDSDSIWTLDQSQLCPVLIKAVQQQQEIIAALEARLTAAGL